RMTGPVRLMSRWLPWYFFEARPIPARRFLRIHLICGALGRGSGCVGCDPGSRFCAEWRPTGGSQRRIQAWRTAGRDAVEASPRWTRRNNARSPAKVGAPRTCRARRMSGAAKRRARPVAREAPPAAIRAASLNRDAKRARLKLDDTLGRRATDG